jgi:hypothetical protein
MSGGPSGPGWTPAASRRGEEVGLQAIRKTIMATGASRMLRTLLQAPGTVVRLRTLAHQNLGTAR